MPNIYRNVTINTMHSMPPSHPKRGRPPTGEAQTPAERMRRYRARQRAAGLRVVTRYEPPPRARLSAHDLESRIIDARALALHCAAAKMIESDRTRLTKVRRRLEYWRRNYKGEQPPAVLDDWAEILALPWTAIALFIIGWDHDAARLSRHSPFEVVLSARQLKRIYAAFVL
jgi:hypothetical protein